MSCNELRIAVAAIDEVGDDDDDDDNDMSYVLTVTYVPFPGSSRYSLVTQ